MKLLAMPMIKTRKSVFITPGYLCCGGIGGFSSVESIKYMVISDFCEI